MMPNQFPLHEGEGQGEGGKWLPINFCPLIRPSATLGRHSASARRHLLPWGEGKVWRPVLIGKFIAYG